MTVAVHDTRPTAAQTFQANPAFASLLADQGLHDCETLFATENGTALRRLRTRENWRLDLRTAAGPPTTLYLKKHAVRTPATRLRAALGLPAPATPARQEAERTQELAALGVPTMTVAAYAERLRPDGTLVAAFLTEELRNFEQADLFIPRRFAGAHDPALRSLLETAAAVAGRFHRLGFNHRDFYSCHFFVREEPAGTFAVHLIDLQRVQRWSARWPTVWRQRWTIKDLAQLAYSCPPQQIGAVQRLRFFKRYLQIDRLTPVAKRLARAVLRGEERLRRKHGNYREW